VRVSGGVIRGADDPAYVRRQYEDETGLRARKAIYGQTGGVDARDVAVAAVREAEPSRVLEVGCGEGELAERLVAELGVELVAIDQSERMVELARARGVDARVGDVQELPFEDGSFDVVISNGAINLSPAKHLVFAEAARVLRPGGRLAIADMVSATALEESTRRNTELWAARIAGAIPRDAYADAVEDAGFRITSIRRNHYRFTSERVRQSCRRYGIESTTIAAVRRLRTRAGGHYDSTPRR